MNKEISIVVDRVRVVGMLDAAPESLTVQIHSPFKQLKAKVLRSGCPTGDRRFSRNGRLTAETIQYAKEILRGLYLAGETLQKDPALIRRLRKYMARFEEKAEWIQQERKQLLIKHNSGRLTATEYASKLDALRLAENQNVIARGVIFRQYSENLTRRSGGRADIQSVLDFASC